MEQTNYTAQVKEIYRTVFGGSIAKMYALMGQKPSECGQEQSMFETIDDYIEET